MTKFIIPGIYQSRAIRYFLAYIESFMSIFQSQNLISDIGGQLGLWLGLSAITIGEIVEFAMSLFRLCTAKFLTKKHRTADSTPVQAFVNGS